MIKNWTSTIIKPQAFIIFFFLFLSSVFSENNNSCSQCNFKNSSEDRYCLECGAEIRSVSQEEQSRGKDLEKQKILNAFMGAEEEFNRAQTIKDEKQKKMCYEAAALHVSVACSKGASFFDRADWKKLSEIKWKCDTALSTLRKRLKMQGVRVPLIKVGSALYVDVLFNETKKHRMILDTGCSSTLISETLAKELLLPPGAFVMSTMADGRLVQSRQVFLSSIKLENAEVKNVTAYMIPGINEELLGGGLLGMAFLENFKFQIDTENSELILEPQ